MPILNRPIVLIAVAGLGLAACTNPDGSTNRTGTGAAIGGVLGAITGAAVSDNKRRGAVVGGIIGTVAGGGIGNILDRQEAELRRDIGGSGARIINTGEQLIVQMPEGILFATESAVVRPAIRDDLFTIARSLQDYPNSSVQVIGHTDNTGTNAFNQRLSEDRAASVSAILRQGGVSPSRIVAFGRGETQPIASNSTPEGRQANRRVEIVITPR